jgi:hypothetical protein
MYSLCNLSVKAILEFQFTANYLTLFYNTESYEPITLILCIIAIQFKGEDYPEINLQLQFVPGSKRTSSRL